MLWSIVGCHVAQTPPIICHFILTVFNIPLGFAGLQHKSTDRTRFLFRFVTPRAKTNLVVFLIPANGRRCVAIVFGRYGRLTFTNTSTYLQFAKIVLCAFVTNIFFILQDSVSSVIAKYSSNGYMDILTEKWYGGLPCFKLSPDYGIQPKPLGKHFSCYVLNMFPQLWAS